MIKLNSSLVFQSLAFCTILMLFSCRKYREYNQEPELEPLRQGLKTSMAVGYCASIAVSAYKGLPLPGNVTFDKNTGFIYIKIDANHPLPFNSNIGDIIIAGIYHDNGGVISILFANIDILNTKIKLYGLYTVPITERPGEGILALFAKQDIVLGYGSDTILNLGNITDPVFNTEMDRLNSQQPTDAFVAVKQNVWFINIDQANTFDNPYDDNFTLNGGGQIAEVQGSSGGIVYHAMINTKVNYSVCAKNPISGVAFTQNLKAGGDVSVDLGNSLLSFHSNCDGKAHVDLSTGKYLGYNGKYISLNIP